MIARWSGREWLALGAIVVFALVLRVAFYTGYFGSDELTYAQAAVKAARGEPLTEVYIGAIRLGVNYPMAAFVSTLGLSEASLAAYGLLSSVAEIALVFAFAFALGGLGLAVMSAFILALVPMHVHLAGRIMADAPLGLFVTATMVAFYFGERSRRTGWFILAGVCAGAVFWIKQATVIFLVVFILWAVLRRRIDSKWWWAAVAFVAVVAMNFLETWRTSGNLWLFFDSTALAREHTAKFASETSAWAYPRYLLLDIRHTALLGWLALAGTLMAIRRLRAGGGPDPGIQYLLLWAGGLVAVFSLFIAQTDPLRLIPKQSNYMTIFLAPLSVLAALAILAVRSTWMKTLLLTGYAGLGLLLAGLQQQSIHAFTANSRATVTYASEHPDQTLYVMTNAYRRQLWVNLLAGSQRVGNLRSLSDMSSADRDQWVVIDPETLGWGASDPDSADQLPDCWVAKGQLPPEMAQTAGLVTVSVLVAITEWTPAAIADRVRSVLRPLWAPSPATFYVVAAGCPATTTTTSVSDGEIDQ